MPLPAALPPAIPETTWIIRLVRSITASLCSVSGHWHSSFLLPLELMSLLGSNDAAEADVAGRSVDRLGVARRRAVAPAVDRCAKVRAALDDLAGDFHLRLAGIVAGLFGAAARSFRNAAGVQRIRFVLLREPVGGPFPGVADHVLDAVAIRRECSDRRGT